jgi:hypothetical protein
VADHRRVHHHRLVLNGPPPALRRLVDELRRAGATVLAADAAPRLVWSTDDPGVLERVAVRHADVAVGVERFEALGTEVVRLLVCGGETTVLDRRGVLPGPEDDLEGWGCELDEEGVRLEPELLRRAARRVEGHAGPGEAGPRASGLDAALALGRALGTLSTQAAAALAPGAPGCAQLDAVAGLAAAALAVGTEPVAPAPAAALVERSWTLTRALARAALDELWDRPGEADWTAWLRYLVAATSDALLACAESVDGAGTAIAAVHREHFATPDEQQAAAAGALVATCLQTMVLFDERSGDRKIA